MLAVEITAPGGPEVLVLTEHPDPVVGPGQVLIDVAATAVNRADLLQRQGFYDPPAGVSTIPGLECSGIIAGLGDGVDDWSVGDRVCALLPGGGYASTVAVPTGQLLPVPIGVDLVEAAALPEAACTVWSNLVMVGGLRAGQLALLHGGASGIGTMAIQVAKALNATVAVTASREDALAACRDLGADLLINYATTDFVDAILCATAGSGADLILDVVGAKYLARNIAVLANGGRLIIIGMQGGTRAELDIGALMAKRGSVISTALRSRQTIGPGSKAEIVAAVRQDLWPLLAQGRVRPVVDRVLPLADAAQAHRQIEKGGHIGKIVLITDSGARSP